jgi:hypothetical protein
MARKVWAPVRVRNPPLTLVLILIMRMACSAQLLENATRKSVVKCRNSRVGVAQRVRGAGEAVVAEVGVVDRDPGEAGQDPERRDRGDAATVLIDVEPRSASPWRRCASSGSCHSRG